MRSSDSEVIAASMTHPIEFAAIFDRHVDPVRRFVARRPGAGRADDVVSEVFPIAFEQRERFDLSTPLALPWLYGIAGNLVRR